MLILVSQFDGVSPDDYLVFYTEYDMAARPGGGFEERSTRSATAPVPEPIAAIVFAVGMALISPRLCRRGRYNSTQALGPGRGDSALPLDRSVGVRLCGCFRWR
jgi:hypothetical protein